MEEVRNYLFPGEEVALMVRPHPVVLVKPALLPLAGVALFAAFPYRLTFIVLFILLVRFSWEMGLWWLDRYLLTTDRILRLTGIITKKVVTLPLGKITDLIYERSVAGRLLGYGSLIFESAGQQDFGQIDFLPDPDEFYRTVMSLALGPKPPPTPSGPSASEADVKPESKHAGDAPSSPPPVAPRAPSVNPDRDPSNTDEVPVVQSRSDDEPS